MALNKETKRLGYLTGRAYAVVEAMSIEVRQGITPTDYGHCLRSLSHLGILINRFTPKASDMLVRELAEIIDMLETDSLSKTLTAEEGAEFGIGYIHQRTYLNGNGGR